MVRSTLSAFLLAAVAGFSAAVISACGPAAVHCTRSNCGGCCTADDRCVLGNDIAACGVSGGSCKQCGATDQCIFGTCTPAGQGGGATGGGTGGGTTGGGTGGGATGGGATGGGTGGGATGGGATGGGTGGGTDVNAEIAAVRAAADQDAGSTVSLPIDGALVTYLKPFVTDAGAGDPAGFFVQYGSTGPALFVQGDPATISGGPVAVGDTISFTVTSVTRAGSVRIANGISGLAKSSSGNPVRSLVQNASSADFTSTATIDQYESTLVSFTGTVVGNLVSAGSGYKGSAVTSLGTLGLPDGGSVVQLRMPLDLAAAEGLTPGCTLTVGPTPLWRFNTRAQPSAWDPTEVTRVSCPAPKLLFAKSTSTTTVLASFDRNLDGTTIAPGAFTISGAAALAVSAASLASPRQVTLTTAPQSVASYTLTVGAAVTDDRGTPIDSTANTATFTGGGTTDAGSPPADAGAPPADAGSPPVDAGTPPVDAGTPPVDAGTPPASDGGVCGAPQVVISQVYSAGGNAGANWSTSYVELHNRAATSVNVTGWTLQYRSSAGNWTAGSGLSGAVPAGGFLLVSVHAAGTNGAPLNPTADIAAPFNFTLSAANPTFALVSNATPLTGCPSTGFVDLVGFGTATCFLGGSPGPALSATQAGFRKNAAAPNLACVSTASTSADFVPATPVPRSSATAAAHCTCP